jgi:hypothetical protein
MPMHIVVDLQNSLARLGETILREMGQAKRYWYVTSTPRSCTASVPKAKAAFCVSTCFLVSSLAAEYQPMLVLTVLLMLQSLAEYLLKGQSQTAFASIGQYCVMVRAVQDGIGMISIS